MALPAKLSSGTAASVLPPRQDAVPVADMNAQAQAASSFLKALAHEGRLMILCHLASGERTVGELEVLLGMRQASVSQQLARLRLEGLVSCRREGKAMYYSIADPRAQSILATVYDVFCGNARS
jgi:DNA-binding transcriptional ArsR family regulator